MSPGLNDRRLVQIRRRGRHTTPSQVEKVAERAGKAAPAMAIAGALVAAPQAQHFLAKPATVAAAQAQKSSTAQEGGADATLDAVISRGVASAFAVVQHAADEASTAVKAATAPTTTYYKVQAGDTLSKISERFYHSPQDWSYIYHVNDTKISNPDAITAGTVLRIPAHLPAGYVPSDYVPRHAAPAVAPSSSSTASPSTATPTASQPSSSTSAASTTQPSSGAGTLSGTLSCSGLEQLWEEAGGNSADAFMAAEIAMAESGGNQYALSPTDDYGYWQINASNGALATYDPLGNAHAAITLSHDGTDWSAWTTYTSGAYAGRC